MTESVESLADREEAERAARRVSDLADVANRVAVVPADLSVLDDPVYEASIESFPPAILRRGFQSRDHPNPR